MYFSTDEGVSWVAAQRRNIELTTAWKMYRLDFEIDSVKLRIKFGNAILSESFSMRMFKLGYMPGSEMGTV